MATRVKQTLLLVSLVWLVYFAVPGPRQVYDFVFGGVHNPQYLFASSEREVCRRLRRVVEHGKVDLYVENLSTHKLHISLSQPQIRGLVVACNKVN